jgi:phenylpropionate dioxygenase-like ring-hydroxylating dioxygenase large terminal subunit
VIPLMLSDPILLDEWFAVARSADVSGANPTAARLLGRDLVLWRSEQGIAA